MINFLLTAFLSTQSYAATADAGKVTCTVKSFDSKIAELICDPETKKIMKTPRSWIPADKKLRQDAVIEFELTREQLQQWPSFNKKGRG